MSRSPLLTPPCSSRPELTASAAYRNRCSWQLSGAVSCSARRQWGTPPTCAAHGSSRLTRRRVLPSSGELKRFAGYQSWVDFAHVDLVMYRAAQLTIKALAPKWEAVWVQTNLFDSSSAEPSGLQADVASALATRFGSASRCEPASIHGNYKVPSVSLLTISTRTGVQYACAKVSEFVTLGNGSLCNGSLRPNAP
jgi:hypothetical protein